MTTYQDITKQVGDQWVAAFKRTEDAAVAFAQNVQEARAKVEVPEFPVPEQVAKFNEAIAERFPKPSEIVEANFELTQRLLTAQRDLTLRLLSLGSDQAEKAATEK